MYRTFYKLALKTIINQIYITEPETELTFKFRYKVTKLTLLTNEELLTWHTVM